MACTIASQALHQATQHEVTVGFEDHVHEVDDDDATNVAQAQLAHDLFGGLKVVAGHRLLESAAGADELAGIDVDDGHRLGAVDDQGAARGQPHLTVHTLGELLVDAVRVEDVLRAHPLLDAIGELGAELVDVFLDGRVGVATLDDELREVLVEDIAHDAHSQLGLTAQQRRGALRVGALLLDVLPLTGQASDIIADLLLRRTFRGGAHDDARARGHNSLEDLLQASALLVRQLAGDAHHGSAGNKDQVAAGQRDLRGQAGALVTDRILRHLNEDRITGLQCRLDTTGLALHADGVPVDLAGVQNCVASAAHVDECRFHRGKHVLDAAQVDVADHRGLRAARNVVLDEQAVFEDRNLVEAVLVADDHRALDRLAASEELGFRDGVATATFAAAFAAAHLLRLQAGGPLQGLDLVRGIAAFLGRGRAARAAATTATTGGLLLVRGLGVLRGRVGLVGVFLGGGRGLVRLLGATATTGLRLGGRLLRLRLGRGSLGGLRSLGLVSGLLGATATLRGSLFTRSRLLLGGRGLAATLGLGLLNNRGRSDLGGSLEHGCLEQQRRGGCHGRGGFGCHDSPMVGARPVPGRTLFHRPRGAET